MADWGFIDDPSLLDKKRAFGAPPEEGHPRQCRGKRRRTNPPVRCGKWAVVGTNYCRTHSIPNRRKNKLRIIKTRRDRSIAGYYSRRAGVTLQGRLQELAGMSPGERHSLAEEVDLARVSCDRAVSLFEAACLGGPDGQQKVAGPETQAAAIGLMRGAIEHVAEVVAKAAKVRQVSLETVDVEQLGYIVDQVTIIIEEEVLPLAGRESVDRVTARLRAIKLPERKGTSMPDREAIARMFRESATAIEESVRAEESA